MAVTERSYGAPAVPVVDGGRVSRLAILGDVHGNAVALAAVLEELLSDPPDLVVVNGDLSWGPEPEETLALAETLPRAVFVRGNAESALLQIASAPATERSDVEAWMLARHSSARRTAIEAYAGAVSVVVNGVGHVFVCHGSPRGDQEIVTPETPDTRVDDLVAETKLDVLVTGHVHLQFARPVRGITSMNAGSVGLAYGDSPAAYWAELGPAIALRSTSYDVDEAERRTRASGIPSAERVIGLLRTPPSRKEIIEHGERLEVSD